MKKRQYEKPSMKVVLLQQRTMLLAGSNGTSGINPMDEPEDLQ